MKEESNKESFSKEAAVSLFDAFDLLKSSAEDAKVTGAAKIIARLQASKTEKDLEYALKRLIRSLGANLPEMRMGYFATLVALLNSIEDITVQDIFKIVVSELHANNTSKSEIGDVSLGRILVCGAIFRSKLIFKCNIEEQKEIIQMLQLASIKKSYLNGIASNLLMDLASRVNSEQFATFIWPNIKQDLKKDIKEHNLDSLYFLMVVNAKFPEKVKLRKLIGVPDLLHEDLIKDLCDKLMTGIDFHSSSHPIYTAVGKEIAKSQNLASFWTNIDSFLLKHNRNRELAAINILNAILLNLEDNATFISDLLSDNFLKLFIDWFKGLQTASKIRNKRDNEDDNKIMVKKGKELLISLNKALKLPSVDSKLRLTVLKKLLISPGEINFTDITGSTIIKTTVADLDVNELNKMAKILRKIILNTSKKFIKENVERIWYNNERAKAAELLSYIVCHDAVKDDIEFKISNMQLLMCLGFFKVDGGENIAVSTELAGSIKASLYRCFTSRFSNVDNLVEVLSTLTKFISKLMTKDNILNKLEKQFSKENMDCWEMHMQVCEIIELENSKSKIDKVFLILLHQLGLFLFSEPTHVKISQSCITELKSCYEHYKKGNKQQKKSNAVSVNTQVPEWIEVVVEVLLSILSVDSSVLRSVVQCVFRLLSEYLTPTCIEQIISILDLENESDPLTIDSDSEEEVDCNLDNTKMKLITNGNSIQSEEESDSSDSDVEAEDDDMKTPEQLRIAVQKALGSAVVPDSDAESIDADMITEEEGQNLDEALADAFRQFHQGKNKKSKKDRKTKKAISDFRIRVLDLLDIYLEKDPQMDICLSMISPLTKSLEFCLLDNQFNELEKKIKKTFKNLTKVRKFSSIGDLTVESLADLLKSVIDKQNRSQFMYQALGDIITCSSTFIISCSQKIKPENSKLSKKQEWLSPISSVLKDSMENYFKSRNCLLPIIFFHKILQMEWEGIYILAEVIVNNIFNKNVRQYRRNEGLELLTGFYRALCRYKPNSKTEIAKILHIETLFSDNFNETFVGQTALDLKKNYLMTLRKLINVIKMFHDNSKVIINIDVKSFLDTLASIKNTTGTNNVEIHNKQNKKKLKRVMETSDNPLSIKKLKKRNLNEE